MCPQAHRLDVVLPVPVRILLVDAHDPGAPSFEGLLGFAADGVFKMIMAAGVVILLPIGTDRLDAPGWLVLVTAAALAACGACEVSFASRSTDVRPRVKHLAAYDTGWLVVTALAFVLLWQGSEGAGVLWLAYQALGSAALAAVFARACG